MEQAYYTCFMSLLIMHDIKYISNCMSNVFDQTGTYSYCISTTIKYTPAEYIAM